MPKQNNPMVSACRPATLVSVTTVSQKMPNRRRGGVSRQATSPISLGDAHGAIRSRPGDRRKPITSFRNRAAVAPSTRR